MREQEVAVIGLGLIGGSLGAAFRRHGIRVRGYDISTRHAASALERGLVDDVAAGVREVVDGVDAVFLATPALRTIDLLPRVDLVAPDVAIIVDTASAKRVIVDAMAVMPGGARMIGGHPIAGSEASGPEAANASLFEGRVFTLSPSPVTAPDAVTRAAELVEALGARPIVVDAVEHDRVLAETSHLPQLLSTVLAATVDAPSALSGTGFRDMTRLAGSDPSVWRDVLLANADEVVRAGRTFQSRFSALLGAIEAGDVASIEQAFIEGRESRERVGAL